jgi:polysaccharide biosynthesis transport protein
MTTDNSSQSQAIYNANFTDLPIDIASFFRALWRRKLFVMAIWFVVQVLSIYLAYSAIPIYQSHAALGLKVLPALPKSELHSETSMSKVDEKKFMESMKRLLSSRKLAMMVIKKLGLHKNDMSAMSEPAITLSEEDQIKSFVGIFLNNLSVSIEKGGVTGVINLSYLHESPKLSADILSCMIEQFWLIMYERPEVSFYKERRHMKQMIYEAQIKLDGAYSVLNTFLSKNDIFFLENVDVMTKKDIEITSSQLLELSQKSEQAGIERIQLQAVWNRAKFDPMGIEQITNSDLISILKEELALAESELARLKVVYAPGNSDRQSLAAKVASLKLSIKKERINISETIRHKFETALLIEKNLNTKVEEMKAYVIRKKSLKGEYDVIQAEIEINRKVYQSVLQQYEALKIETLFPYTLNMIDPPLIPHRPIKPQKSFRVLLGFALGLIFGCSIALLIEFTNPGLRAPVEAERRTGLPLLGAVPGLKERKNLKSLNEFEQYRNLEGWPEFNQAFNNTVGIFLSMPKMSVSITSPKPGEKKALAAIGICRQLIAAGKKVVLVDADFSSSMLEKTFDLKDEPGLLDILEKMNQTPGYRPSINQLKTIFESAGNGKLFALKIGGAQKMNTPLGLIETRSFVELLDQYKSEADYVIIITPPLLKEVATYIINKATDTTILVLQERTSKIKDAVRATEVMLRVGISILGLIVTESDSYNK